MSSSPAAILLARRQAGSRRSCDHDKRTTALRTPALPRLGCARFGALRRFSYTWYHVFLGRTYRSILRLLRVTIEIVHVASMTRMGEGSEAVARRSILAARKLYCGRVTAR